MSKLPGLDLLRAVAVVWVMLFHSFLVGGLGEDFAWLSRYGWMGVDIFFVLSGFLIGRQVLAPLARGEGLDFAAFYARRAWRILPAYAVVLAIYLALPAWREVPALAPWWQFATFTLNLVIDYTHAPAFSHAWSLCVEEHFYLGFPLLAVALARRASRRGVIVLAAALVLGGVALRTALWLHGAALDPPRNWFIEDVYFPTWNRLDGLLAGVLLAALAVYRPQTWARLARHGNAALLLGLGGLGLALWLFRDRVGLLGNSVGWPVLSAALACLVLAGASEHSLLGRWRVPGAGAIAAMSYSLYLSHKLVFHAVQGALQAWPDCRGIAAFVVYAVATLAGGALLYVLVERPCLALRERRARVAASGAAMRSATESLA